ncbi:hypothetical protein D3C87_1032750 [compost metagenome]
MPRGRCDQTTFVVFSIRQLHTGICFAILLGMKLRSLLVHLAVYFVGIVPAFGAMECRALFDDQEVSVQIQRNDFNTERTMTDYREVFYQKLVPLLKRLQGPSSIWADMGAGSALAQLTFLKKRVQNAGAESLPTVRAYAYKFPGTAKRLQAIEKKYVGAFQYIEGKQSPETLRELEKVDLITDVVGIASYYEKAGVPFSQNALEITKAYIDMLKPGGVLLIHPYMNSPETFPAEYRRQVDFEIVELLEGGQSLMITKKLQPTP